MNSFKIPALALMIFGAGILSAQAQKYMARDGHIHFLSETPLENIEADNNQATSIVDMETKEMAFSLLMKGFHFDKALMEEHFNEKYVESDKFPKSTFKGSFSGEVDPTTDGQYPVTVSGELMIHGVTKEVETEGLFVVKDGTLHGNASFAVSPEDYEIEIPKVVKENIAKSIAITVEVTYAPYEK